MPGDFNKPPRADRKPYYEWESERLGRLPPAARRPRGAPDRVLAVVAARVPNVGWSEHPPREAEQNFFGQGPPLSAASILEA